MSKVSSFCNSITTFISPLFLSLTSFYTFLLTNPLYLAYFLFFSPHLFKLLSFLYPLLICISLLLLSLLTLETSPHSDPETFSQLGSSSEVKDVEEEIPFFEFLSWEIKTEEMVAGNQHSGGIRTVDISPVCISKEIDPNSLEEHLPVMISKESDHDPWGEQSPAEITKKLNTKSSESNGPVVNSGAGEDGKSETWELRQERCGSIRREKEWKRTLACKLYEERKTGEGGEGMDLLWEVEEVDSRKAKTATKKKKEEKVADKIAIVKKEEDEDEEDEDEEMDRPLCCLQAFKFSARKMNFGMRRPNLVKFSKALKGMGLLGRKEKRFS